MQFSRFFTRPGVDPLQDVEVESRTCEIPGSGFRMENVIVPCSWSQNASNVVAQKYLRKAGVPDRVVRVKEEGIPSRFSRSRAARGATIGAETDVRHAVRRMVGCWTYWGFKMGLFSSESDGQVFYDELCYSLIHQMWAPNSPQWFNTGLHWAYGIEGNPQGHYYYDEAVGAVALSKSAYERPQPHACFIQSVADDLVNPGGIMDLIVREARLFKYGSGTGTNFSMVRAENEPLSGGGKSSGLMSFLKIGDRAAAGIKSGGTTRRAAKMVLLDCDHPEIESFVKWKASEEQKVLALVAGSRMCEKHLNAILRATFKVSGGDRFDPKLNEHLAEAILDARDAGMPDTSIWRAIEYAKEGVKDIVFPIFDTDWQGAAYDTVSGQQSNNSVSVTNAFLEAVEKDSSWDLVRRTDGEVHRTIKARSLWSDICMAAWSCADPGLQFNSTMNEWHTCLEDGRIKASNPCSEYMFLDDTACNLASINLVALEDDAGAVRLDMYRHLIQIVTTVLEISVEMSQLPSAEVAKRTWEYRTLGLGYANLGALLMRRGLPYDSDEARGVAASLTAILTGEAYAQSARMASEIGTFSRYGANSDSMMRVMWNHRAASLGAGTGYRGLSIEPRGLQDGDADRDLVSAARSAWDSALQIGKRFGFRNAQASCIAPTGTIGIEMDCDTTGIEPDFALVKFKALAGGGAMTIINQSVPVALERLGYDEDQIGDILTYIMGTRRIGSFLDQKLGDAGFTSEMFSAVSDALKSAPHILFAVSVDVVGHQQVLDATDLTSEQLNSGIDLLTLLGFTPDQIDSLNDEILGRMTIEGAPHVKLEHIPVFDCAGRCGLKGTRFIDPMAHIKMMSAVQPFVSGAISKTVNMPRESTLDDVRKVYLQSWKLGLKAVALYRNGSKLSQPLESSLANRLFSDLKRVASRPDPKPEQVNHVVERLVVRYLADRRKLPHKRSGYTQKVVIDGHKLFLRTGEYADGTLGEIFIDSHKEGAAFRSLLGSFAMAISIGLQHGVPLERFVSLYTFTKFEPNGTVWGDDRVKMCTSILDYIFRNLAVNYLGRDELAHVPADQSLQPDTIGEPEWERERTLAHAPVMLTTVPIDVNSPGVEREDTEEAMIRSTYRSVGGVSARDGQVEIQETVSSQIPMNLSEIVATQGYSGNPCPECHALRLVRNGSCEKCLSCGASTSCS